MAGNKYIANSSGTLTEVISSQSSAGAGDAGKIPALDATGRLDTSMMPVGIGPDSAVITASEALSAGDFVNVWSSGGLFRVRKADASTSGKEAHGFVLAAVSNGGAATCYFDDLNTQVAGATPGPVYLSATVPGGFQAAAPTGAGQTVQRIGVAVAAATIIVQIELPITLA